jgi:hypothetical protein
MKMVKINKAVDTKWIQCEEGSEDTVAANS